jgi:hypothetical protein
MATTVNLVKNEVTGKAFTVDMGDMFLSTAFEDESVLMVVCVGYPNNSEELLFTLVSIENGNRWDFTSSRKKLAESIKESIARGELRRLEVESITIKEA